MVEDYKRWKIVAVLIALLMFCGNMIYNIQFIKVGSGHYLESLDYISKSTPGPIVSISSNAERVDLINFYHLFRPDIRIIYVPYEKIKEFHPEWFIAYSYGDKPINDIFLNLGNIKYKFAKTFLYAGNGLIGSHWSIYHRIDL